jgi:large subunit ribosomal protein L1
MDVADAVQQVKAGQIEFKTDKLAGIHVGVGKRSFEKDHLLENITCLVNEITASRPKSLKGNLIRGCSLSTTMGMGLKVAL